ncbi:MAG: sigma 54-interacting transcriptional regulator [Paracoccaceae bacterium]
MKASTGKFEQAQKGTLFLDEIGDMPADLQTKLLRVLENSVISKVGSNSEIKLDVRIVCATHKDLD